MTQAGWNLYRNPESPYNEARFIMTPAGPKDLIDLRGGRGGFEELSSGVESESEIESEGEGESGGSFSVEEVSCDFSAISSSTWKTVAFAD